MVEQRSTSISEQPDDILYAPWSKDQVIALNDWQRLEHVHPFTCGKDGCRAELVATVNGWICPFDDYTQNWAHAFMADQKRHPPDPMNGWRGLLGAAKDDTSDSAIGGLAELLSEMTSGPWMPERSFSYANCPDVHWSIRTVDKALDTPWSPRYVAWMNGALRNSDCIGGSEVPYRYCEHCQRGYIKGREAGVEVRVDKQTEADVRGIVALRNLGPGLIAEIAALKKQIAELESAWHVETMQRKDAIIAEQEAENDRCKDHISELSQLQEADSRTIAALVETLKYVRDYASAHHADLPVHLVLHALTVDIPALCDAALAASVPDGIPEILRRLDHETEERIVTTVERYRCDAGHVLPEPGCWNCARVGEIMATETET